MYFDFPAQARMVQAFTELAFSGLATASQATATAMTKSLEMWSDREDQETDAGEPAHRTPQREQATTAETPRDRENNALGDLLTAPAEHWMRLWRTAVTPPSVPAPSYGTMGWPTPLNTSANLWQAFFPMLAPPAPQPSLFYPFGMAAWVRSPWSAFTQAPHASAPQILAPAWPSSPLDLIAKSLPKPVLPSYQTGGGHAMVPILLATAALLISLAMPLLADGFASMAATGLGALQA